MNGGVYGKIFMGFNCFMVVFSWEDHLEMEGMLVFVADVTSMFGDTSSPLGGFMSKILGTNSLLDQHVSTQLK